MYTKTIKIDSENIDENVNDSATGGPFDGFVCKGDSVYCFLESGIYTMKLKMVDKNSKVVYRNIDFTVL